MSFRWPKALNDKEERSSAEPGEKKGAGQGEHFSSQHQWIERCARSSTSRQSSKVYAVVPFVRFSAGAISDGRLYRDTHCIRPSVGVGESNRFRCNVNGIIHGNK